MEPGVKHYMLNSKEDVNKLPIRPGQLITSKENQILLDMNDGRRHPLGVQMGTQDLIDGESDLATGVLYVVMGGGGGTPGGGGSAPSIKVDSELSDTSTNPVQNKVITKKLNEVFQSVSDGKEKIASAITDSGIEMSSDATFAELAGGIHALNSIRRGPDFVVSSAMIIDKSKDYVYIEKKE